MKKNDLINYLSQSNGLNESIAQITAQKIEDFKAYQTVVLNRLNDLLQDYFPTEIVTLCNEYIYTMQRIISVDNLWIDTAHGKVSVRLNPNRYNSVEYQLDQCYKCLYHPSDIKSLETCMKKFKDYELLLELLEENIEEVYEMLCTWKMEDNQKKLQFLNSIDIPVSRPAVERYKITVKIEKIKEGAL